jgi:hypothetical protein
MGVRAVFFFIKNGQKLYFWQFFTQLSLAFGFKPKIITSSSLAWNHI